VQQRQQQRRQQRVEVQVEAQVVEEEGGLVQSVLTTVALTISYKAASLSLPAPWTAPCRLSPPL
jgi:hypothetical protein